MVKLIKNIVIIFAGLVAAGYLALVCVYALPTGSIQENVMEAANIIEMEESHPELIYGHQDTMLDNLTDSIMMGTARYEGTESIFQEALLANRKTVNDMMDSEILAAEVSGEDLEGEVSSYGRYWHGYLLYLKPLLMVLNYGQIRYLITFIQFALFVAVLYLLIKKNKEKHIIPFAAAYLFLNPAALSLSLQYLPASVITMLQFVIIIRQEERYRKDYIIWIYHFFIVGCLISYFDFLTYPLLTLGMPLVFLLTEKRQSIKESVKAFVGSCAAWGAGYAMMWGSKWVLGTLLTKENMIADALGNVLLRVGATESDANASIVEVIVKNISANKLCLLAVVLVCIILVGQRIVKKHPVNLKNINIGVLLCAALPFMWYAVVSNHSYIHYWFTYRVLAVSIYAGLLIVIQLFEGKKED